MGKPAARCGDTVMTCNDPADLPVGKIIAAGTVMINGMPAAKQNDQVIATHIHIIMNPSPGGPVPTPTPHPFVGMLSGGLSTSVKIMGMPAAIVGSEADNMPPHIPIGAGPFRKPPTNKGKVIMGSPNVMIGNGGGGGGGGGGSSQSAAQATAAAAEPAEGHFLRIRFVDKGGKPITGVPYTITSPDNRKIEGVLAGPLDRAVPEAGSYEVALKAVTKAEWSVTEAKVGDRVKMKVETFGVESGESAEIRIFIRDSNFADRHLKTVSTKVDGGRIEEEWELQIDEDLTGAQESKEEQGGYSSPSFYFKVLTDGLSAKSGLLVYADYIELELEDEEGKKVPGVKYYVRLPNGGVREGYLDSNGYAKVEGLPPGKVRVDYDIRDTRK